MIYNKKRGIRVTDEKTRKDMRREKKGRGMKVEEGEGKKRGLREEDERVALLF